MICTRFVVFAQLRLLVCFGCHHASQRTAHVLLARVTLLPNLHPAQLASCSVHISPRSTIGTQSGDDAGGRWLLLPPGWAGPTYGFPPSRVAESPTRQVGCPLLGRPGGCDVRVQQGCIIGS